MIYLLKRTEQRLLYWQIWANGLRLIVHYGEVGEVGETEEIALQKANQGSGLMSRLAQEKRREGYQPLDKKTLRDITVQYRIDYFGSEADLAKRHEAEELLDEALGWTGNGYCEGGDIGSGEMNIYCCVLDVIQGYETITQTLRAKGWLEGANVEIASEQEED